ncbi:hypothetical protein JCM10213_008576 [Rhodosporidiobolus nylandii]
MQPLPPISMLLHRPAPEHREGPPPRLAPPPPPASSSSSYPSRVPCLPPNYSTSTSGRKLPSLAALYPFSPDSPVPSATPTTAEKPEGPLAPLDGDEKQEAKRIGMVDGAFRIWETQGREVKRKRYATSTDSRGYIPVIEYPLNSHLIMADSETGYVLITAIWRALGRTKADVVRLIESQPEIALLVRKVRGGQLQIQGTWLLAFSTSKPRRDLKKRDEARAAALKAQNNPKRVTAGQAREGRRLAGTSAGGAPVAPAPPTMPAFPSYAHRAQLPPLRLAPISSILPPAMLYPYPTPCTATLPEGWGWEAKQGMQGGK